MNYCITHSCPTEFPLGNIQGCIVVSCPPPTDTDLDGWEYIMSLPVPSEEELLLMDMSADVLEADFIGDKNV